MISVLMLKTCLKALRVLFEQIEIHGRRKHSGKRDVSIHEPPLEMGFIDKLIELFKIRKISARSQERDGTIRRIIQWVCSQ